MLAAFGEVFCAQIPCGDFFQVADRIWTNSSSNWAGIFPCTSRHDRGDSRDRGFGFAEFADDFGARDPVDAIGVEQMGYDIDGVQVSSPSLALVHASAGRGGVRSTWKGCGEKCDAVWRLKSMGASDGA